MVEDSKKSWRMSMVDMISIVTKLPTWLFSVRFVFVFLSFLLPYVVDVFLQYNYLLLTTFISLLLFTHTTFTCCCCYFITPLHFEFWKSGEAEADFVVGLTTRESIQRNVLLSNLTIGKSRGWFCRRLEHKRINPKKCNVLLSNFEN